MFFRVSDLKYKDHSDKLISFVDKLIPTICGLISCRFTTVKKEIQKKFIRYLWVCSFYEIQIPRGSVILLNWFKDHYIFHYHPSTFIWKTFYCTLLLKSFTILIVVRTTSILLINPNYLTIIFFLCLLEFYLSIFRFFFFLKEKWKPKREYNKEKGLSEFY